jgi:hypothetical protein
LQFALYQRFYCQDVLGLVQDMGITATGQPVVLMERDVLRAAHMAAKLAMVTMAAAQDALAVVTA